MLHVFTLLEAQIYTTFLYLREDDIYCLFLGYIRQKKKKAFFLV